MERPRTIATSRSMGGGQQSSAWLQTWFKISNDGLNRNVTYCHLHPNLNHHQANRTYCFVMFCPHCSTFFEGSMATLAPSTPSRGLNDMNSDANWFTMISDVCCCMCHQAPLGAPALQQVRPSNVQRSPWCRHQWGCGPCDSQLSVVWIGSDIQRWTWCNTFITQGVSDFCFNTLGHFGTLCVFCGNNLCFFGPTKHAEC